MADTVISIENVSKSYQLGTIGTGTFKGDLNRWWARQRGKPDPYQKIGEVDHGNRQGETLWALKDINFQVQQGEVLGIIGRNGAGKSTLLKILSEVTAPTSGEVKIKGRIASLLEVGTGFHPELTGRENIYLNGAILGMNKAEISHKFDEIVDFSGIEKFIDTPVKRYSSGMYMRLGFAVAAHLEPEILLIDEVLAVGDAAFQKKCLGKMGDVAKQGRTVLFVSHNMQAIRQLCGRTIFLDAGRKALEGESIDVVRSYLQDVPCVESLAALAPMIAQLPSDPVFRLRGVDVLQDGQSGTIVISGRPVEIAVEYDVFQAIAGLHIYFVLCDLDDLMIFDSLHNGDDTDVPTMLPGRYVSRATIPADFLAGGTYSLRIGAAIHNVRRCIPSELNIKLNVCAVGLVNRAYPGYVTRGKIAPLIPWHTRIISSKET
jgi:lipopolysaccharide transport system ATP-binding protein